jgi:hypothetical protein
MFAGNESIWENPSHPSQGRLCDLRVWLDALPSGAVIHGSAQAQGWKDVKD